MRRRHHESVIIKHVAFTVGCSPLGRIQVWVLASGLGRFLTVGAQTTPIQAPASRHAFGCPPLLNAETGPPRILAIDAVKYGYGNLQVRFSYALTAVTAGPDGHAGETPNWDAPRTTPVRAQASQIPTFWRPYHPSIPLYGTVSRTPAFALASIRQGAGAVLRLVVQDLTSLDTSTAVPAPHQGSRLHQAGVPLQNWQASPS